MRSFRWFLFVAVVGLSLVPLASWLVWWFRPTRPFPVVVINKTASDPLRQEHRSLVWLLHHWKLGAADRTLPDPLLDYFGFHPLEPRDSLRFDIRDLEGLSGFAFDSLLGATRAVYYADAYGVYRNDWDKPTDTADRSPKVYGGMTHREVEFLGRMRDQGKLVICEFNTMASPTPDSVRRRFERTFDLRWSGWALRHFDELDTIGSLDLPRWAVRLKLSRDSTWNYRGPGILFVHEDSRLVVLEARRHLVSELPWIHPADAERDAFHLPDSVPYPFWIDIVHPGPGLRTASWYRILANDSGARLMREAGLPDSFPAALRSSPPARFWYFAGDHADNRVSMLSSRFAGIESLMRLRPRGTPRDLGSFFWKYQMPLLHGIFEEAASDPH